MPSKAAQAKAPARKHKYRLQFVPSAWEEWQKLDGSVKEPLRKLLKKRLDNPHVPGAALHGALAGLLTFVGAQLVYAVAARTVPNPLAIVFGVLMFSSLGTIGAYVAVWKGAQRAPTGGDR